MATVHSLTKIVFYVQFQTVIEIRASIPVRRRIVAALQPIPVIATH
jgi:hypothetical protein